MVAYITDMLGLYTPLSGEGLASLNLPWIVGAIFFLLLVWFIFRLILKLVGK